MRIYLTGASGFVGSNLAHVFAQRHNAEVVAPGHEHVDLTNPVGLARRAVAVFELDPGLLDVGPAPASPAADDVVPCDTRLSAVATAAALDVELPSLETMLPRLRGELEEPARSKPGSIHEEVRT